MKKLRPIKTTSLKIILMRKLIIMNVITLSLFYDKTVNKLM